MDLRSLYKDAEKSAIIEDLILGYEKNLTVHEKFDEQGNDYLKSLIYILLKLSSRLDSTVTEPASAILWTYFYLAQHYDYHKNSAKALHYINLAVEHTPTLIELFVAKGRIFKV